jgi:predicted N-acetyltransferase YhbS
MDVIIRQETYADYPQVFNLVKQAFSTLEISDHTEQFLVERLRNSAAFIPELSIVAEYENKLVGHILLTKIKIVNKETEFESLSLAPVAVLPEFQNKGIGGKLILHAHKVARNLGFKSVILVGHENYYPRFGYKIISNYAIKLPFDAPEENCMAIELVEDGLKGISGDVIFPKEFFE